MQIIRILQNGFCFAMRFYILSGWEKIDFFRSCAGMAKADFCKCAIAAERNRKKRRYGKAKNHQKLRRSGTSTFKPVVGMGDGKSESRHTENPWERTESTEKTQKKYRETQRKRRENAEKTQRSTRKTHGSAQEVQKAQKTQKKYRKRRNHTACGMKRGDGRGDKIAARGGENALNTNGKSCAFQVLF